VGVEATLDETAAPGRRPGPEPCRGAGRTAGEPATVHPATRKGQLAEQRRFMLATFEAFARRLGTEIKESTPPKPPAAAAIEPLPMEAQPRQWWPVAVTALLE